MARQSLLKSLPRLASTAPLRWAMFAEWECPAIWDLGSSLWRPRGRFASLEASGRVESGRSWRGVDDDGPAPRFVGIRAPARGDFEGGGGRGSGVQARRGLRAALEGVERGELAADLLQPLVRGLAAGGGLLGLAPPGPGLLDLAELQVDV